jgi:CHAD domain-containing protein
MSEKRAYRLLDGEPVPEGIRRIARGRIDHALDELLGKTDSSPEEAVHEARKDMKKLRALLRLVRAELDPDGRRVQNIRFRDAARRLSGVRDAEVMLATLDALPVEEVPPDAYGGLRQALELHRRGLEEKDRESAAREVVGTLREARADVDAWQLERDSWQALAVGLRWVYRRGRREFELAREQPTTECLHEWRKRAKDLWYHLTILRESWPAPLTAAGDEAHALADRLGDDHDIAVLEAFAHEHATVVGSLPELDAFCEVAERRRAELQADAFALGARLYAESPRAFSRRMGAYWGAWREQRVGAEA